MQREGGVKIAPEAAYAKVLLRLTQITTPITPNAVRKSARRAHTGRVERPSEEKQ